MRMLSGLISLSDLSQSRSKREMAVPMDESEFVDSLDSEDTFCHVEASDVFRKRVVFDQHGHEVTPR